MHVIQQHDSSKNLCTNNHVFLNCITVSKELKKKNPVNKPSQCFHGLSVGNKHKIIYLNITHNENFIRQKHHQKKKKKSDSVPCHELGTWYSHAFLHLLPQWRVISSSCLFMAKISEQLGIHSSSWADLSAFDFERG